MPNFEEDYAAYVVAQEDTVENRLAYREMLAADVQEFYNMDHNSETGRFDVGSDGPGRKSENLKKAESAIGKKAPAWMKNLISRRLGKARTKAEKMLPKNAAQYQKDLIKRRAEAKVLKGE